MGQLLSRPLMARDRNAGPLTRKKAALAAARAQLPKRKTPQEDFHAFVKRVLKAYGRRVSHGDPEALRDLLEIEKLLKEVIKEGVHGLRREFSLDEIADRCGFTRQNVHKRWGKLDKPG